MTIMRVPPPDLPPLSLDAIIVKYVEHAIPLPGRGCTLARWELFKSIAAVEGAAAIKLFEAHADAVAILAEIANTTPGSDTRWAVWAAEPPDARVNARQATDIDGRRLRTSTGLGNNARPLRLNGRKAWCSGAYDVSHALITCNDEDDHQILAAIEVGVPGATITGDGWHAVGMRDTRSFDVRLADCPALQVGAPRAYLDRPGFWHGGAGIAACWYGAVLPFHSAVQDIVRKREDPHAAAHLGAIDCELGACAALLHATAAWIDANPDVDAFAPAMRIRLTVEAAVHRILLRVGNVLGAGPLCKDAALATRFADLPVFLRQSHAERDLAALGRAVSKENADEGPAL